MEASKSQKQISQPIGRRGLKKEEERMKSEKLSREMGQESVFGGFVELGWLEDNGSGLGKRGDG